mgnify:FL=1
MAHFAKLGIGNIVEQVVVVSNNELLVDGIETEFKGIEFLNNLFNDRAVWKKTSYSNNIRKNFAGIGGAYDQQRDAFIPPKNFPSWVLDETTCRWEAPTPRPDGDYIWNEETQAWDAKEE